MLSLVDRSSFRENAGIVVQIRIRVASESDATSVRGFLAGLSVEAAYLRFFTGLGSVSPHLVRTLVRVTPRQDVAIALDESAVIAHAMATTVDPGVVELAVVVGDGHRRQGIATRLLGDLLERATERGARQLRLDVLSENNLVLDWIRRSLPQARLERDGTTMTGYADLPLREPA